jgi:hypothetical protein
MVRDFRLERHATGRKRLRRVPLTPCPLGRLWTAYTRPHIRERIASQLPAIGHWQATQGDYRAIDDIEATWFIDPPYQLYGATYPCGSRGLDYTALAEWCRTRRGQVIVCEGQGARWLPFEHFADGGRVAGASCRRGAAEVVWYSDERDRAYMPAAERPRALVELDGA